MAKATKNIEGGQGGKKGHSNMAHWTYTEEIKKGAKKARRRNDKFVIREQFNQ